MGKVFWVTYGWLYTLHTGPVTLTYPSTDGPLYLLRDTTQAFPAEFVVAYLTSAGRIATDTGAFPTGAPIASRTVTLTYT